MRLDGGVGFTVNIDALVDTGADVTLFSEGVAAQLGLDLSAASEFSIGTALGTRATYRAMPLTIELRRKPDVLRWTTTVGFVPHRMAYGILGTRGFFEFFHFTYDVTEGFFELEPKWLAPATVNNVRSD